MSGHNKWSQIKHKKAKEDAKKGQTFTKLIKEITVAARSGGGDPAANARLRHILDKAREVNMPIDNAQRAIKRGTGELPGVSYEEFTYEGYGPFGIAIVLDTLSDNKNRTVAELRHLFSANGGNLGESGSVCWMFEKMGVIEGTDARASEEFFLELFFDVDIKDIKIDGSYYSIYCDPKLIEPVKDRLAKQGLKVERADIEWVAKNTVSLSDDQESKVVAFLSLLQDHEDVQNVYSNMA